MNSNRPVRVIKRGERQQQAVEAQPVASEKVAARVERDMKTVISGWVVEHRQRTEEFRQTFASLFRSPAGQSGTA